MSMHALIKDKPEVGLWETQAPIPTPQDNEIRIRIEKTAICGTDIHIWNYDSWAQKTLPLPIITGHEYFGIVDQVGSHVKRIQVGMRVSGEGHIVCRQCDLCRNGNEYLCRHTKGVGVNRQGCFAEYLVIPEHNAIIIPKHISGSEAAILDPFGNATHTALNFNPTAKNVVVLGAGPIGIMAAKVARFAGARSVVITDINPTRLELAKKLSGATTLNVKDMPLSEGKAMVGAPEGFDICLETSGSPMAVEEMIHQMNNGGKISLLGILPAGSPIDWEKVVFHGLSIQGIYGRKMFETWEQMLAMVDAGFALKPFITHELPVGDYKKGFELMLSGECAKVVLDWT